MTFWGPEPRSTESDTWPDKMMYRPSTGDGFVGKDFTGNEGAKRAVRGQPGQLFPRRGSERLVFREAVNQVHSAAPVRRGVGNELNEVERGRKCQAPR